MNKTLIRPAVPVDVGAIARVHLSSWQTTYRGLMPDQILDNLSFSLRRDWWKNVLSDPRKMEVVVAEVYGRIVGFANYGVERENDPIYRGELYALYILKDYQKKGIGCALMKASAQGLLERGMCNMLVWVLSTNPARGFYEKMGGVHLRDKPVNLGGFDLEESAYGWDDIHALAEMK